ncbi:MAG: hypothetical protein EXR62_17460 [Chloroflexi bacterium]|nr:hypothetical protein [Chloroflexota bacterium]
MSHRISTPKPIDKIKDSGSFWPVILAFSITFLLLLLAGLLLLLSHTPLAPLIGSLPVKIFALNSVHTYWYITRAAGLTAYLLLWLSTAWGLAVSNKIFDALLDRTITYEFHQFISLLAIGFTFLHMVVLMADQYLPFSPSQILVPFTAEYRPLWTGIGIIGMYLVLLVSVTFYIRRWIGRKTFRIIHYLSFLAYGMATLHGFMAGTDSTLKSVQWIYGVTALTIIFLTLYPIFIAFSSRSKSLKRETPVLN